jgi:hypothetical protein
MRRVGQLWRVSARCSSGARTAVLLALALGGLALVGGSAAAQATATGCEVPAQLAGPPPSTYDHVVVIMDENLSWSSYLNASLPHLKALAASCGLDSFYHAASHPSKQNYWAATSGLIANVASSDNG